MAQSATISLKGTGYYSASSLLAKMALSNGTLLSLRHEKDNPHDANAVAVHIRATGAKLGHIPREYAPKYAALVDQGMIVGAKISSATKGRSHPVIHITVTYDLPKSNADPSSLLVTGLPEHAGVYSICNTKTDREYIGSSKNVKQRIVRHFSELRAGSHSNRMLQEDYLQYGQSSFKATLVTTCSNGTEGQHEAAVISQRLSKGCALYNVTEDGQGIGFRPRSFDTTRSISDKVRPPSSSALSLAQPSAQSGCLGVCVIGFLAAAPLIGYAVHTIYT